MLEASYLNPCKGLESSRSQVTYFYRNILNICFFLSWLLVKKKFIVSNVLKFYNSIWLQSLLSELAFFSIVHRCYGVITLVRPISRLEHVA